MNTPETTEIVRSLGRIEGKLDGILRSQVELRADQISLRSEIDGVKAKLHWYSGGVAAFAVVLSVFKDKLAGVFV